MKCYDADTIRTRMDDATTKIVCNGANPFRPGTIRHKQFELASKAGTVAEFLKAGGDRGYLSWLARNLLLVKVGG